MMDATNTNLHREQVESARIEATKTTGMNL